MRRQECRLKRALWVLLIASTSCLAMTCNVLAGIDSPREISDAASAGSAGVLSDAGAGTAGTVADAGKAGAGAAPAEQSCPAERGARMILVEVSDGVPFCVDSTETTNAEYLQFLLSSDVPVQASDCEQNTSFIPSQNWPVSAAGAELPVVYVDFCDAAAYCAWAGKRLCGRLGGGAQLDRADAVKPRASEWYYACSHAGTLHAPFGAADAGRCNSHESEVGRLQPVASTTTCEGGFDGIFDMVGNVAEWVDACDGPNYTDKCVVQGGSFADPTEDCTQMYIWSRSNGDFDYGIRCCANAMVRPP